MFKFFEYGDILFIIVWLVEAFSQDWETGKWLKRLTLQIDAEELSRSLTLNLLIDRRIFVY
jgi:hypothetical protein